ncbi:MAG: AMP-binding protein [Phycisphaerae bacterium]|nr:AMP-binding protein [Phycisphaerae bacterium]
MSVHWPIIQTCLSNPLRVLITDDQRRWRAIELLVGALHLASEIERRSNSWTVGVLLPTGGAFPIAALAAWITGRTVVPLNYLLNPDELQYVIDDCETDCIITAGAMLSFLGRTPRVKSLIRLDEANFRGIPEPRWPACITDDRLAVLLYTSGTSGRPKGVMLSHANLCANISQVIRFARFTRDDAVLGVLPQFHTFGFTVLTLLPLTVGARAVYAARFVPQRIVKLCREHRPTAFIAIPSMFNALLHVKDATPDDVASLRFIVSGGEPLPEAVSTGFRERFGKRICEGYGLTETSPVTNWCPPDADRPHSVGPPLPGVRERIVNWETGHELAPGEEGEIRIKGPNVMRGYYKLPAETAAAFDEEGWFRTGDIGRLDHDHFLSITGRLKEMIIVGGENVFPREIEEVLDKHPSIAASAVIGVRDHIRGELPCAFVELKAGASFDEPALRTWCRERLAGFKVPREIHCIEKLPRNPTGKILRRELKQHLLA